MTELDRLFEGALAVPDLDANQDEYWSKVRQLHGRTDEATFLVAAALAESMDDNRAELGLDVLGQLGYESNYPFRARTIPVVISRLGAGESTRVLVAAISATHHLDDPRLLHAVVAHAHHGDFGVRVAVVMAIPWLADDPPSVGAVNALIGLMSDDVSEVRDWATFGLGRQLDIDTPAVRAALAERLFDTEGDTADEALIGLAMRGDRRMVDEILDRLSRATVSYQVLVAAAELPDSSYRPVLLQLRADGWDGPAEYLDRAIAAVS